MRKLLLLPLLLSACYRTVYLPEDAATYKIRLDACEARRAALADKAEKYLKTVEELREECR